MELDCNAAGVRLTEAEVYVKLDDQNSKTFFSTEFEYLCPPIDYASYSLEEIPLLLIQVTRFICGAVGVALSTSHVVADGKSMSHFYSEWSRLSRGEPLGSPPIFDSKMLRGDDPPRGSMLCDLHENLTELPTLIGNLNHENQWIKECKSSSNLQNSQVEGPKCKANESSKSLMVNSRRREYSLYEALTAHIWRSSCRAHNHVPEQPTTVIIFIDTRRRFNPPLPENYFGDAVIAAEARSCSGEIVTKPLEFTLSKIRETIERCTNPDYINSRINFFKQEEDLTHFQFVDDGTNMDKLESYCGNPNILVTDWLKIPIDDKDFGWGKECQMSVGNGWGIGQVCLLPGQNGDGSVDVFVPLQASYTATFEKVFYEDID